MNGFDSNPIPGSRKWMRLGLIILAVLLFVFAAVGYYGKFGKEKNANDENSQWKANGAKLNYTISSVPYFGIFNHAGKVGALGADMPSALASILEYWNPDKTDFREVALYFKPGKDVKSDVGNIVTPDAFRHYLDYSQKGLYDVREEHLEINELKKYVNPQSKTPLIFFNSISGDAPSTLYYRPFYVLVGINEAEKKVILHDFWLGNNNEISFDEFKRRWDSMRPDERNKYIVIQPVNLEEKLKEIGSRPISPYPKETLVIQKSEEMLKNEAIGQGFFYSMNYAEADDYLLKVINHPDFDEYFPPYLKVITLEALAIIRLDERNFPEALDFANRALALDHDLSKPLDNGWPGIGIFKTCEGDQKNQLDATGMPNRVLGDIYREMGDLKKARENYQLSLEKCERLNVADGAKFWLEVLNEKLAR